MLEQIKKITILGDGGWGTTLAVHLARRNQIVKLWGAFPGYIKTLNKTRENRKFLPGIKIPKNIIILDNLATAVGEAEIIILAVPSQYARNVIHRLKEFDFSKKIILSVIKGIEIKTLKRISEIIRQELGPVKFAVLSGPTIASEVAKGIPTTAVVASVDLRIARALQDIINSDAFRIYTNNDIVGVELGGSLKNVIAIACGVCDGLGYGTNAKAAILSRGLAEMARLATAMGAKSKTLFGLSGLGDLATTCFSPQSRNRSVGEELGRGETIRAITASTSMVAEGITTAKAVLALSRRYKVSMPISEEVYNIIYKNKKPIKAVSDLMRRKTKPE